MSNFFSFSLLFVPIHTFHAICLYAKPHIYTYTYTLELYVQNTICHHHPQPLHHKRSRNNSVSAADYSKLPKNPHGVVQPTNANNGGQLNGSATPSSNGSGPFKPVPPPKPKNYRPPVQSGGSSGSGGTTPWENGVSSPLAHDFSAVAITKFPLHCRTLAHRARPTASTIRPRLRTTIMANRRRRPAHRTRASPPTAPTMAPTARHRLRSRSSNRSRHSNIIKLMATMATVTTTMAAAAPGPT